MEKISMYIRAGLTHLAADIRNTALEMLEWALQVGGEELVSSPGGWIKTLKTVLMALAWNDDGTISSWTSSRALVGRSGDKALPKTLTLLAAMLRTGMVAPPSPEKPEPMQIWFPLWHIDRHRIPNRSNAYGYLNLFGPPKDEDSQGYEDIGTYLGMSKIFSPSFFECVGLDHSRYFVQKISYSLPLAYERDADLTYMQKRDGGFLPRCLVIGLRRERRPHEERVEKQVELQRLSPRPWMKDCSTRDEFSHMKSLSRLQKGSPE